MQSVKPKKHLGQHFLKDENIARKIVNSLSGNGYSKVLEVGPGMGILTKYLLQNSNYKTFVCEIDPEAIVFLKHKFPQLKGQIIEDDFLKLNLNSPLLWGGGGAIIGNFPYNISSQILFKVLEHHDQIMEVVGMFQREVAQRISSPPGNKSYGILSVLMQAYYKVEYLFTVNENAFYPPPKVKSAVMRFIRNDVKSLNCNEALFFKVVKTGFNQRRKTLRNAIKSLFPASGKSRHQLLDKRAEQLSVEHFIELTNLIERS
ncbi:16S rRNA (adenine(1518)-N(6)/adenine(1519)-N(6))-dimethyltransferase RsmA [bacterium AH-315-M05]|nr:16S rRNA (adenine(1518)-N(6)/adenine(1519)-N(6))-dimethyltransferase RsmA [bacterium AH-315-M05]